MRFQSDQWAALLTLSLVAAFNLWLLQRAGSSAALMAGTLSVFAAFGLCFVQATGNRQLTRPQVWRLLLLQYALVMLLFWLTPYTFNAILLVIWSALLPYLVPFRRALFSSPFWSAPPWLITYWLTEQQGLWISALLFWTFNLFALVMMDSRRTAEQQRALAEQANSALRANELLVQQAARAQERTRIARDLHDLIGHHLTALIINLQVAGRRSQGESAEAIARSETIARMLMADVRAAVSDLREDDQLDLQAAVASLADAMPGFTVAFELSTGTRIRSVQVAAVLLRCLQEAMTNAVRHGAATHLRIEVSQSDDALQVRVSDNGQGCEVIVPGNGLHGMRERLATVGGELELTAEDNGVVLTLRIPHDR